MGKRTCVVFVCILSAATVFCALRWLSLEQRKADQLARIKVFEQDNARLNGTLDSLMAAITPGGQPENNSGFWYNQARRARENQGMLLYEHDIRMLREMGLEDPVNDLRKDLAKHPELIPYDGVLGGTMYFRRETISLLSRRWVYAEFEDGHIEGRCLLEYSVAPGGKITWRVIEAVPH